MDGAAVGGRNRVHTDLRHSVHTLLLASFFRYLKSLHTKYRGTQLQRAAKNGDDPIVSMFLA